MLSLPLQLPFSEFKNSRGEIAPLPKICKLDLQYDDNGNLKKIHFVSDDKVLRSIPVREKFSIGATNAQQ